MITNSFKIVLLCSFLFYLLVNCDMKFVIPSWVQAVFLDRQSEYLSEFSFGYMESIKTSSEINTNVSTALTVHLLIIAIITFLVSRLPEGSVKSVLLKSCPVPMDMWRSESSQNFYPFSQIKTFRHTALQHNDPLCILHYFDLSNPLQKCD